MARSKPKLVVLVAPEATAELADIWCWNAEHYSQDHADRYVDFLKQVIFGLALSYSRGRPVGPRPDLRYALVRRSLKGMGTSLSIVSTTRVSTCCTFSIPHRTGRRS